ncbi:MAG TPA: helix-turn-helix domain-containing protein [Polyangiaceae bacterium]|nr:helix-turn-helix domain-containing protein [Polyangiaceae bacterium]
MTMRSRQVWFVVFPGSEMLDISGPWAVLSHANDFLRSPAYELHLISPKGGVVSTGHGVQLAGARSLVSMTRRGTPDLVVISGGSPLEPMPAPELAMARWLTRHQSAIPRLVSICTGAFVLAEAGLLKGKRATTHHLWANELGRRYPDVLVSAREIFQRHGRVWTSAGITAGIDLALALVEQDHGHAIASAVAKKLVLFLRRSGNQTQFSRALEYQEKEPTELRGLVAFVLEHLSETLSVPRLARKFGMSARSLTRQCHSKLGASPAALVRGLRIDRAKRLLEETNLPLKSIAADTGLGDASTIWRYFSQQLGVTPAEYRARFASDSKPAYEQR